MDFRDRLAGAWELTKTVLTFVYGYWLLKTFKHMFDIGVLP